MFDTLVKDPDARLDYVVDWTDWLAADTISTTLWTADPGINVVQDSFTALDATVWLDGGTLNNLYVITCRITTAAGRINDRSFQIRIRNQ